MSQEPPPAPVLQHIEWSDEITAYDEAHLALYLRLLDAKCDGASQPELLAILKTYAQSQATSVDLNVLDCHLQRAQWMTHTGFRLLLEKQKKQT